MGRVMELAGLTTAMNEMESALSFHLSKTVKTCPLGPDRCGALVKLGIIHGSYEDLMPPQGLSRGEAATIFAATIESGRAD